MEKKCSFSHFQPNPGTSRPSPFPLSSLPHVPACSSRPRPTAHGPHALSPPHGLFFSARSAYARSTAAQLAPWPAPRCSVFITARAVRSPAAAGPARQSRHASAARAPHPFSLTALLVPRDSCRARFPLPPRCDVGPARQRRVPFLSFSSPAPSILRPLMALQRRQATAPHGKRPDGRPSPCPAPFLPRRSTLGL